MRADICEPDDASAVARFRALLEKLGAVADEQAWAIGVDMWSMDIDGRELRIFQDAWSLDIEGPDDLVAMIVQRLRD
jgi:hypothetical protein